MSEENVELVQDPCTRLSTAATGRARLALRPPISSSPFSKGPNAGPSSRARRSAAGHRGSVLRVQPVDRRARGVLRSYDVVVAFVKFRLQPKGERSRVRAFGSETSDDPRRQASLGGGISRAREGPRSRRAVGVADVGGERRGRQAGSRRLRRREVEGRSLSSPTTSSSTRSRSCLIILSITAYQGFAASASSGRITSTTSAWICKSFTTEERPWSPFTS